MNNSNQQNFENKSATTEKWCCEQAVINVNRERLLAQQLSQASKLVAITELTTGVISSFHIPRLAQPLPNVERPITMWPIAWLGMSSTATIKYIKSTLFEFIGFHRGMIINYQFGIPYFCFREVVIDSNTGDLNDISIVLLHCSRRQFNLLWIQTPSRCTSRKEAVVSHDSQSDVSCWSLSNSGLQAQFKVTSSISVAQAYPSVGGVSSWSTEWISIQVLQANMQSTRDRSKSNAYRIT